MSVVIQAGLAIAKDFSYSVHYENEMMGHLMVPLLCRRRYEKHKNSQTSHHSAAITFCTSHSNAKEQSGSEDVKKRCQHYPVSPTVSHQSAHMKSEEEKMQRAAKKSSPKKNLNSPQKVFSPFAKQNARICPQQINRLLHQKTNWV